MTQDELDNMPVGWSHLDYGGRMVKISDDQFMISDNYGNSSVGNSQWVCSVTGGIPGSLGSISSTTNGSLSQAIFGGWPPQSSLTAEEKKELDQLEEDRRVFIKHNRLNKFKMLPKHLRQEIVDEGYVRDLANDLMVEDDSKFPDLARLSALKSKNSGYHTLNGILSVSGYGHIPEMTARRFTEILKHFKTEELAKAHAEACLEEEINN